MLNSTKRGIALALLLTFASTSLYSMENDRKGALFLGSAGHPPSGGAASLPDLRADRAWRVAKYGSVEARRKHFKSGVRSRLLARRPALEIGPVTMAHKSLKSNVRDKLRTQARSVRMAMTQQ